MGVFGQGGCIREKVVILRQKWLCLGKKGCIRAKVVVIGQKLLFSGKVGIFCQKRLSSGKVVVVFKSGCIRANWLYAERVVLFGQKGL